MKRNKIYYILAFILSAFLLFTACAPAATQPSPTPIPTNQPSESISPSPKPTGGGTGAKSIDHNVSFDAYLRGTPEMNLEGIESLPAYKVLYPIAQTGPEYEITDELLVELEGNLIRYLRLIGFIGENEEPELSPKQPYLEIGLFICEFEEFKISSRPNGMSISPIDTSEFEKEGDDSEKVLQLIRENKFLSAACQYLGIQKPSIICKTIYNRFGEPDRKVYMIYEAGDTYAETAFNLRFNYLTISWFLDMDEATILIEKIDTSEKGGEYSLIPYGDALENLSEIAGYEVKSEKILACELSYSAFKEVAEGDYYIPCYRFYIDEGEANTAVPGLRSFASYLAPAVDYESVIK